MIAYMESDPYLMDAKRDPQTGTFQYIVGEIKEIPPAFSLISSDVLSNLRSTLDHLAYQLVIASGNQPDRRTAFPIFNTAEEYKTNSARKVKLMTQTRQDAIMATKPYKGGNDLLWRLSMLDAISKHRLLVTIGVTLGGIDAFAHFARIGLMPTEFIDRTRNFRWKYVERKPLKVGDVLFHSPSDQVDEDMEITAEIAFYESRICECEPIIETLHSMADLVSNILSDFETLL